MEELKDVLDFFKDNRSRLDIRKTPETYIKPSSSPEEVQEWLKAKEFDVVYVFYCLVGVRLINDSLKNSVQKRLKGMTGAEVFKLKKGELEKHFGKEEGHRLDSQLTLQRKASGVSDAFVDFRFRET